MSWDRKLLLNWIGGVLLVLLVFYGAVSWLWRASEESAAASLRSQVVSALSGDLAEGNLFKLGATLSKLGQGGQIRFAEIREIRGGISHPIYRTVGGDDGLASAFSGFACNSAYRLARVSGGGVGIVTTLPSFLAGAECTAAFISSDLPIELKNLKTKIVVSFGAIIIFVMTFILVLTISWHKKVMVLEVAAKTAIAEKEASIGRLAAQVAHDIRSPLAALGSAAKGLELPEEQRTLIDGAVGRIQGIADDLLARYRAPGAEVKAKVEVCALGGFIEQVVAEKRLQHSAKTGVQIDCRGGDGIKAAVNQRELQRIISNLVNNAVEAYESEGKVTVALSRMGGRVLLKISDNGKGISAEILAKLGRKGETHGKAGGTGLGLYHARTSVESWGGTFKIDSKPGSGTTVAIELPSIEAAKSDKAAVLIDDDALVRMNWKTAAKCKGVSLQVYSSLADFFAAEVSVAKDTPVYLDSDLGDGIKGEEIAQGLREKGYSSICLETGHSPEKFSHIPWLKVSGKEPPWQ